MSFFKQKVDAIFVLFFKFNSQRRRNFCKKQKSINFQTNPKNELNEQIEERERERTFYYEN